ncbi:hypothetical protein BLOT_002871 [Blomia tropicalis]|nr:hypothetical protein BLOT_002871 [Blomia tropicalis]
MTIPMSMSMQIRDLNVQLHSISGNERPMIDGIFTLFSQLSGLLGKRYTNSRHKLFNQKQEKNSKTT